MVSQRALKLSVVAVLLAAAIAVVVLVATRREGLAVAPGRAAACTEESLPSPCTTPAGTIAYDARRDDCTTWFPRDHGNTCPGKNNRFATRGACVARCKPGLLVKIAMYPLPNQQGAPFYVDMGEAQLPGMIVRRQLPRPVKSVDVPAGYALLFMKPKDYTTAGTLRVDGPRKANVPAPFNTLVTVDVMKL